MYTFISKITWIGNRAGGGKSLLTMLLMPLQSLELFNNLYSLKVELFSV